MKNLIKRLLARTLYRPGSTHKILRGALKGMEFRMSESTGFAALYSGNERANQELYASLVREGDTVVDAGANWGVHTLCLARLVGASGKVHAFEPHPGVVKELRWNVERNGLRQVSIHACGLLDKAAVLPFVLGASTKSSHVSASAETSTSSVSVPCKTLDSLVSELGLRSLRLLKLDVEGAESLALKGAADAIARFRPHLVIELHTPEQDLEVAHLLTAWNYTLTRLEGPPILHLDRSWPDPKGVWGTIHAAPNS